MNASDLFVAALEEEGGEFVFGIPGEENLDLLESLRRSKIKLVLTRHEQAAGFMAATYGRLSGKTGVCLATVGPGATNLTTAAAYAQLGGMPMLMITGQKASRSSRQGSFQVVDMVRMMEPVTKYSQSIASAATVSASVREAFRRAEDERPGAVHLELPEDVAQEEGGGLPIPRSHVRRAVADEESIEFAVEAILKAKRPLLMVGSGGNRKPFSAPALRAFVEQTGIPFFTTQMGKGVVDETHVSWLGNASLSEKDFVHDAIECADCIISVGHDVVEKPPFIMRAGRQVVIHVNYLAAQVDPVYFPQIEVIGDIAKSVQQMTERLRRQKSGWDVGHTAEVRRRLDDQLSKVETDFRFPLHPLRLVADLREAMPTNGIVCLDNGMYKMWFARHYRTQGPNTLMLDNALATMGAGLPSAIASKLVHPERRVVAVCGDGGFMMNSQELETAVRLNLDLTVLVLRDNAFGMVRWKQEASNLTDFGTGVGNPGFVEYARSYGAFGHRLSSVRSLLPLLKECTMSTGVHVIEVPIDYGTEPQFKN